MISAPREVVIIGAGPSGLGVAYELAKREVKSVVYEKNETEGGLSRSFLYKGYYFDVGPHRFFTKNNEVFSMWQDILGKDLIEIKRLTRIYHQGKYFFYPIKLLNALRGLGLWKSAQAGMSFLWGKIKYGRYEPVNFEEWMVKNFGKVLYETFFKTYTEKVWGMPGNRIGPEWANQRIKNLNLWTTVKNSLGFRGNVKSLTESFWYPSQGAGMLYEKMGDCIRTQGSKLELNTRLTRIYHQDLLIKSIEVEKDGIRIIKPVD